MESTEDDLSGERRRSRFPMIAMTVVALVTAAAGVATSAHLYRQRGEAGRTATSRQLAALAVNLAANRPREAMLLAAAAWRAAPTVEARGALLSTQAQQFVGAMDGPGPLRDVAINPTGDQIAAAVSDGTVSVWDLRTRRPAFPPLHGHLEQVNAVAYSPDGRLIASASHDESIRLWDARTGAPVGKPLSEPRPQGFAQDLGLQMEMGLRHGATFDVAFSPDSTVVAGAQQNGDVVLWDVRTGAEVGSLSLRGLSPPGQEAFHTVAFNRAGTVLATGGGDNAVRLWRVSDRRQIGGPLTGHRGPVRTVAFSPDGTRLASAGDDEKALLWDTRTRRVVGSPMVTYGGDATTDVEFSPDGKYLAGSTQEKKLYLWDVGTQQVMAPPLAGHRDVAMGIAYAARGDVVVSAALDGGIMLWEPVPTISPDTQPVFGMAMQPHGTLLATAGASAAINLFDVAARKTAGAALTGHQGAVYAVAFSPDGTLLASGGQDGTVRIWDVAGRRQRGPDLVGHRGPVRTVAFRPDGGRLVSGGDDGTIRVWETASGAAVNEPIFSGGDQYHEAAPTVTRARFSADGQTVVTAAYDTPADEGVQFWSMRTFEAVRKPLRDYRGAIFDIAVSPDGAELVTVGRDQMVRRWDMAARTSVGPALGGHTDTILAAVYGKDGRTLVTSGLDTTMRIWSLGDPGDVPVTITGMHGWASAVAVSDDGNWIATAVGGQPRGWRLYLWDTDEAAVLDRLCRTIRTDFTEDETRQYLGGVDFARVC
ncbi:WD40 repeat domain-containing protein [Actinoplanes xinjiangensis]|uniref:WD40 repeat domain-containing protein n=1 Tax=Actinoplanes xinjiangensis TaxID=512350 RepID=UPI003437482A